jgi:protein-tyrosine phosphatase
VTLNVLFVCTGNVCRSPVAQRLFEARVSPALAVASSAGTQALTGHPIDGPSALALRELGVDPSGHQARQVTPTLTAAADLILTATTDHRSMLVQAEPLLFRRVFTLREFARLAAETKALETANSTTALTDRVHEIAGLRGWVEPAEVGADNIGDPFGGGLEDARRCAAIIAECVGAASGALGLTD